MKIDSMSPEMWKRVTNDVRTNTTTFQGRKVLYVKPGEIEWFDNEKEAAEKGFHPAQAKEIHELASKQLQGSDLTKLDQEFSSLIEVRKGKNLLENPNSAAKDLHLHGMLMIAKGKKLNDQTCKEIGQKCLEQALSKFTQEGNLSKANACKKVLIQNVEFKPTHPLFDLGSVTDIEHIDSSLPKGVFIQNLDGGNLKNATVKVSNRIIDETPTSQISFKTSYPARIELESHLQFIKDNPDEFKTTVCKDLCSDVIVTQEKDRYLAYKDGTFQSDNAIETEGEVTQVEFVGVGKIRIGSDPKIACSYNHVEMEFSPELKPGETLTAAQKMLYATGLTIDLSVCQSADFERRKVMTLFHNYFPQQAFQLENQSATFTMDPETLKREICEAEPRMQEIFDYYVQNPGLITEQEIYPDKKSIALSDIPSRVREAGGVGLMVGLPYGNVPKRAAAILKTGPMATQDRYEAGLLVNGASSTTDYSTGGGESIFTRMVTETSIADEVSISTYPLSGKAQILVDLDVLARGGYAFFEDAYGQKNRFGDYEVYSQRLNLWECTVQVNDSNKNLYSNEFMVKNHIPPSFIKGMVVADNRLKTEIIDELRNEGLIDTQDGQETINGKPLDEFINVGKFFKKEMWE